MPKKAKIKLIEYDRNQLVVDIPSGRLVVKPDEVRFHKNGKGRGAVLVED